MTNAHLRHKAQMRELGTAPLATFIEMEFALARKAFDRRPAAIDPQSQKAAERFFRETVRRYDQASP